MSSLHLTVMPDFKQGDPPPRGYLEWQEWARIQHNAGLRQSRCTRCNRYSFPQELEDGRCAKCEVQQ